MNKKLVLFLAIFVFGLLGVAGSARAVAPTVVSADYTGLFQATIVYSEAVTTTISDYSDFQHYSTFCGNWANGIDSVSGNGTDTITLDFPSSGYACADATGTIDIAGVTNLALEPIVPIDNQPIADKQNPSTFLGCPSTNFSPTTIYAYFDEGVDNFAIGDIGPVTNGTADILFPIAPSFYLVQITPIIEGPVTVDIAGGVADDTSPADNPNNVASQCSFNYDITLPTLVSAEVTGPNTITVVYSEPVVSYIEDYINLGGDLAGRNITAIDTNGPSTTFNLTLDGSAMGTDAAGTMDIISGPWGVFDTASNYLISMIRATVSDGQEPVLLSAQTQTTSTIVVIFSEDLNGATITNADFDVAGYPLDPANDAFEITPGVVLLTTIVPFGGGETPDIDYDDTASGGVEELPSAGGKMAPSENVTPTDGILPTVTPLGDGLTYFTIPAGGSDTLTFSEPLSATGKTNVETAILSASNQVVTFGWDIADTVLTINGHPTNLTTFASDVVADVEDANGIMSPDSQLIDSIGDATPPVITLTGSSAVTIESGATYTDAGATALDDVDGDITSSIVTINPVNTNVSGTYTITYNVSDAVGNPATQATRSVTVNSSGGVVLIPSTPRPTPPALPTLFPTTAGLVLGATTSTCSAGDLFNGATGKPCAITGQVLGASTFKFTQTMKSGSSGNEVKELQKALNLDPDTMVASTGVGSSGKETTYFGAKTKTAVIKFQNKYKSEVLTPIGLTSGTGTVGAMTRTKLNAGH